MVHAGECDAFNIGINMGAAAGQTVMYPHVHLIPRRHGDCADPIGWCAWSDLWVRPTTKPQAINSQNEYKKLMSLT
jgi:diadenosine tetraphosphate (Ap4A) HIT family hydrolase